MRGNTLLKKIIYVSLITTIICGGAWFYFNYVYSTPIKAILENPRMYEGKTLAISGEVIDRMSLVFLKYFKLQDKTGEIVVITKKALPGMGSKVRLKGRVEEAFVIGNEQWLIFIEEEDRRQVTIEVINLENHRHKCRKIAAE